MISSNLLKAQRDLHSHRLWLAAFHLRTRHPNPQPLVAPTNVVSGGHGVHSAANKPSALRNNVRTKFRTAASPKRPIKVLKAETESEDTIQVRELRRAVRDLDVGRVVQLYSATRDKSTLQPKDVRILAQCLHYSSRAAKRSDDAKARRENREALVAFAETLVKDLIRGVLAPHCQAHVHLLGFFKESGVRDAGVRFWQWLEAQDELHVNPDVYGAAIELLAVDGSPLSEMESLYQQALTRFPGPFLAYHLSPEAIVPDRARATSLRGIPMALLQGILTARLMHGDARNAYLAFDTALRLYPDQVPNRFFQLFLEERPLLEAYAVFAIACRAGTAIPSSQFRQLMSALRTSSNLSSPVKHAFAVRSMLSVLYLYVSAGGQVSQNVLNELIIAITQILRLNGVENLDPKNKQKLVEEAMDIVRKCLAVCARYGAKPGLTAFNSIITNLGGFGQSKQIVGIALVDALSLGLQPNEVTHRSILTAAGTLRDGDFVKKAWLGLVQARADLQQQPDATDFHVLAKNAIASGQLNFAKEEFERLKESLPSTEHHSILEGLGAGIMDRSEESSGNVDQAALLDEMRKIRSDLSAIAEMAENGSQVQDLRSASLPMTLLPREEILSEAELRSLYDELTTEQRPGTTTSTVEATPHDEGVKQDLPTPSIGQPTEATDAIAITSTNIPFSTLRYENWKSINYLLGEAEASDKAYLDGVDQAIAAGRIPPQRKRGLGLDEAEAAASFGLSDVIRHGAEVEPEPAKMSEAQIERGRRRILALRGRVP